MAERDGLCRANFLYRRKVELIKESQYEKDAAPHQEQWTPVHFYSCEEPLNQRSLFHQFTRLLQQPGQAPENASRRR